MTKKILLLAVAVDCLSRYLRVAPLKSKYATTTADAFRKMIENKQPIKVYVHAGISVRAPSPLFVRKMKLKIEKLSAFAERNIQSPNSLKLKYFEEKLTYSYINQLLSFIQNIKSRVNSVTKLAPEK